jgi:hypothetical protein
MGANATSRLQTQHDVARIFAQVSGSLFDSVRRRQIPGTVLDFSDTERSLVQIQYGPRHFSKSRPVLGTQIGASHLRF